MCKKARLGQELNIARLSCLMSLRSTFKRNSIEKIAFVMAGLIVVISLLAALKLLSVCATGLRSGRLLRSFLVRSRLTSLVNPWKKYGALSLRYFERRLRYFKEDLTGPNGGISLREQCCNSRSAKLWRPQKASCSIKRICPKLNEICYKRLNRSVLQLLQILSSI